MLEIIINNNQHEFDALLDITASIPQQFEQVLYNFYTHPKHQKYEQRFLEMFHVWIKEQTPKIKKDILMQDQFTFYNKYFPNIKDSFHILQLEFFIHE